MELIVRLKYCNEMEIVYEGVNYSYLNAFTGLVRATRMV